MARRELSVMLCVGALGLGAVSAGAQVVNLNVPAGSVVPTGQTAAMARYRVSNTNWDHMMSSSSSVTSTTIVGSANIGTHHQLNAAAFDFVMSYTAGTGYQFSLNHVNGGSPSATSPTVVWTAPSGDGTSPTRSFNAIELFAKSGDGMPVNVGAGGVRVSNLSFAGSGLTTAGALVDMADLFDDSGVPGDGFDPDNAVQWLVADTDLSQFSWTLTGRVEAWFSLIAQDGNPGGNIDERLRFDVKTTTVQVSPVVLIPSPAAGLMGLAGLGIVGGRRRR